MRVGIFAALCGAVLVCGAAVLMPSPARGAEPAGAINTAYFCDDINAAVVIHPRRILESPLLKEIKLEDRDVMLKDLSRKMHCSLTDIDEFAGVIVGPAIPEDFKELSPDAARAIRGEMIHGGIIRFHSPIDKDTFAKNSFPHAVAAEFQGKKYLLGDKDDPERYCVWFPDDKTVVMANEWLLQKMMGSEKGAGAVADLLQKAGDHDVVGVVAMQGRLREQLKIQTMSKDMRVPPNFKGLLSLPDKLKTAVLVGDTGGKSLLSLTLTAHDEDGANSLYSYLVVLRDAMKIGYAEARPNMERELPPEAAPQFLKVADAVVAGFKLKREDALVTVTLPAPAGWEEFPKAMVALFAKAVNNMKETKQLMRLRQTHQAWMICKMRADDKPITDIKDKNGKPLLSWRVNLLPYLGDGKLTLKDFHLDEPWDSEHNKKLIAQMPSGFGDSTEGLTSCFVFVSGDQILANRMMASDIGKIVLIQAGPDKAVPWTKPSDIVLDRANPAAGIGKVAGGKANAVFHDGRVEKIDVTMDPVKLLLLILPEHEGAEKDSKPEDATPSK